MHRPSLATRLRLPSHDPGDAQAGADSSRPGAGALERCRQFVEQSAQSAEQSADRLMRASAPRVRDAKASAERLGRDAKAAAQRLARDAMAAAQRLARDAEQRARQLAAADLWGAQAGVGQAGVGQVGVGQVGVVPPGI